MAESQKKYVLVTGGAGGLGMYLLVALAAAGYSPIVVDSKTLAEFATSLAAGPQPDLVSKIDADLVYIQTDLTKPKEIRRLARELLEKGVRLHHVISLAGGPMPGERKGLLKTSVSAIQQSIALNLTAHVLVTKFLAPLIVRGGGIVYISSINAVLDFSLMVYSACKAALEGLSIGGMVEFGALGIRLNVVMPGTIVLDSGKLSADDGGRGLSKIEAAIPLGMAARASSVAKAIIDVCENPHQNGSMVVLDGGQSRVPSNFADHRG